MNFGPSRTEAVLSLAGRHRARAEKIFFYPEGQKTLMCSADIALRIVSQYRHLGTLATRTGSRWPEIAARALGTSRFG